MDNYLERLNENQRKAVETTEGPVLVLAGAGSGKTTVLASRIAYLLQSADAKPWEILAITFTNKAAREMSDRIEKYVGNNVKSMWIGTFHSVCVRILRTCIDRIGYSKDFTICDSQDSRTLMKECLKEEGLDEKSFPVRGVLSVISNAKNDMIDTAEFRADYSKNVRLRTVATLYEAYQNKLKRNNALDFDDIIMFCVKIFRENPDLREKFQSQFKYILVDEYQDTNNTQYELIRLLTNENNNVCVVGDDDQSIYSFRGANINNILDFQKDFNQSVRITLDENYRSTSVILDAANAVISHNVKRMGKALWTSKSEGEKISFYTGFNEKEEASFIARSIIKQYKSGKKYGDCAILYRTNAQSRAIEEAFMLESVPYKVLSGNRFYDRKEIKDIIAYLKLIYNTDDDISFERIINEPKRKIGAATVDKIKANSLCDDISMFEVIKNIGQYDNLKGSATRIRGFAALMDELRNYASSATVEELVVAVVEKSGYMDMLRSEDTVEAKTRIDNIAEFVNVAHEFSENSETSGRLADFIEKVTLVSDIDEYDENDDSVVMMTIHSAKGLEFPVVFIAGLEEDLFPSVKSITEDNDVEEERRLCYVAMTRAKEKLYLTRALSRMKFGQRLPCIESRFLKEIPSELVLDESDMFMRGRNKLEENGINIMPSPKTFEKKIRENPPVAVPEYDFKPGDRVRHRKFGDGTVVSAQSFGRDAIVIVDFDTAGNKRLMALFAKLERIEGEE